jgi:hypothetical protein
MLDDVEATLATVLKHFGIVGDARTIAAGPALQRYSKAPGLAYTPRDRTDILNEARRAQADEIGAGLRWVDRLAQSHPRAAPYLDR